MPDLQLNTSSDVSVIFETERSPQCYMGATVEVSVDRPTMAELLTRIGKINTKYDSDEDIRKMLNEAMDNYIVTAEAYVSENPYNAGLTRLDIIIPLGCNEFGESYGNKYESVYLDAGESTKIYDSIVKMMGCENRKEFSEKVCKIVESRFSSSTFDFKASDINVYRDFAQNQVDENGCAGDSHLHCDFYLPRRTQAELLMKTGYLKDHTFYYKGNYTKLTSYEEDIDNNIRFKYSADLYTDGTGTFTISQYDIKAAHQYEVDYRMVVSPTEFYKFRKEIMTVPLKENEIEAIKSAIDRYHAIHHITITTNEILENIAKDNLSKKPDKIFVVSTEHMEHLFDAITENNISKKMNECIGIVDKVYPSKKEHGFIILSCPFSQADNCRNIIESIYKSDYIEKDSPINERTVINCDFPYIVKPPYQKEFQKKQPYIEAFVDLNNYQLNAFLSRCSLQYGDNRDAVHSTDDLREDTWIDSFVKIDESGTVSLIMQIDGTFSTQSSPVVINLSEKEQDCLKYAIDSKCKENGMSLSKLKSQLKPRTKRIQEKE